MELAVITPSYLSSPADADVASAALDSLYSQLSREYPHIVVDDVPRFSLDIRSRTLFELPIPDPRYRTLATEVYDRDSVTLVRRFEQSSVTATLDAISAAKERGAELVFLHLDDNVYGPQLGPLLEHARDAFERRDDLRWLRFSGYPVLSSECTPTDGNRTVLERIGDEVHFDGHTFSGIDCGAYTLWSTELRPDLVDGTFWPVTGWTSVYDAEFLEQLLTYDGVADLPTLAGFEVYYKNRANWTDALSTFEGTMGFINMQYAGVEMEHNENWRDLLDYPNEPVR